MKGKWKVSHNPMMGKESYTVVRLIDENKIDHSGNREYKNVWFSNRQEAEAMANELNKEDIKNGVVD